jgi:hypothetical protein
VIHARLAPLFRDRPVKDYSGYRRKLTPEAVRDIYLNRAVGPKAGAERYGISVAMVHGIRTKRCWVAYTDQLDSEGMTRQQ